jgi:raffinose/stachyose/melibiose transport system permease protein
MKPRRYILTTVVMIPLAAIMAIPFYYIVVNTLKTRQQASASPLGLPFEPYFGNYVAVFRDLPILQSGLNSLYVTVFSVALMLIISSMGAYVIVFNRSRWTAVVQVVLVIAFLVPLQATLLPIYRFLVDLRLVDTLEGLILVYSGGAVFCYFLIHGYMRSLPLEIIEAARIDGAGPVRIYRSIVLPLIRPILVTVGVFQTMFIWNDFILPNVLLSSPGKRTLVLQTYAAVGQFSIDWPMFMTVTVIVLIPMVVFFILMQRQIVSGLVAGGIKG